MHTQEWRRTVDKPLLITVTEAAEQLALSKRRVYELANAGVLTKRFVGSRNFRLSATEVARYADSLPTESPQT